MQMYSFSVLFDSSILLRADFDHSVPFVQTFSGLVSLFIFFKDRQRNKIFFFDRECFMMIRMLKKKLRM